LRHVQIGESCDYQIAQKIGGKFQPLAIAACLSGRSNNKLEIEKT